MNKIYRRIGRYTLLGGTFLVGTLFLFKDSEGESTLSASNHDKLLDYQINSAMIQLRADSAKPKTENTVFIEPDSPRQYVEDVVTDESLCDAEWTPQENYLMEEDLSDDYAHYSVRNKGRKLTYLRNDTVICVREKGTLPWRNNNPGALKYGPFAKKYGAIGRGNRNFAVFPTREMGVRALKALLQSDDYRKLTLSAAIDIFAPSYENDTEAYKRHLSKITGVALNKKLQDLSNAEFERVVATIIRIEGNVAGKETLYVNGQPVSHKDTVRNTVVDTLVRQQNVKTL